MASLLLYFTLLLRTNCVDLEPILFGFLCHITQDFSSMFLYCILPEVFDDLDHIQIDIDGISRVDDHFGIFRKMV